MIDFLITIISVLIGYALGKDSLTKETYQDIKKQVEKRVYPALRQPSQIIQRPDAKRLHKLNNPKIEEETEEMKRTLDGGIQPLTP